MHDDFLRALFEGYDDVLIGTHIWPRVQLSDVSPLADPAGLPRAATRVIDTVNVNDLDVSLTALGGMFVRPPAELLDDDPNDPPRVPLEAKMAFEEQAAAAFNVLICELGFHGFPSEPASPASISRAHRHGEHIAVLGGTGRHHGRASGLLIELIQNSPMNIIQAHDISDQRSKILEARRARQLSTIADALPRLIAGAYHLHEVRQPAEAVLDAWIVAEQLLDHWWKTYIAELDSGQRRERLKDTRAYSAGVRTEVLHIVGRIDGDLYDRMNETRKIRNDLAHGAKITYQAADTARTTMDAAIGHQLGEEIAPPWWGSGVNW